MIFVLIEFSLTFPVLNDFLPNLPGCLIASGFALSASTLIMGRQDQTFFFFFLYPAFTAKQQIVNGSG